MTSDITIAVISDLHVHSEVGADAPSYLSISAPENQPQNHPIAGLKKLITDEGIRCDLLLNAGDSTDKADPASLRYAWEKVHELKDALGASHVVATTGNHDLDSRYSVNDFDAKGAVQALSPMFPGLSDDLCDRFWSRNFVLFEAEDYRVLVLNSAAYHGGGKDPAKEMQRGRVSTATLAKIEAELAASAPRTANILLCHHHLVRDTLIAVADYSEMDGGERLLELLSSGRFGQWLVVHGHKHHPKLFYAGGGSYSATVLGAGSLSAKLYPELGAHARNQFHVVRLPISRFGALGVDLAGVVNSWDWVPVIGWQRARPGSGLPFKAGFGYRLNVARDAAAVDALVRASGPYTEWETVLSRHPELEYLLPQDHDILLERLRRSMEVLVEADGVIRQMSAR